ncbi:hypothetical protein U9M48_012991 [Paspalum notatum var. saurae]|uniref:Uncharacterized protein n=1 Tax=Paspalum notatum var. saurae TaxID=547442 RepID=A0AAQ3T1E9_PASNO
MVLPDLPPLRVDCLLSTPWPVVPSPGRPPLCAVALIPRPHGRLPAPLHLWVALKSEPDRSGPHLVRQESEPIFPPPPYKAVASPIHRFLGTEIAPWRRSTRTHHHRPPSSVAGPLR